MKRLLLAIICFPVSIIGYSQAQGESRALSAADIVTKAHEALGDILRSQASVRSVGDLESFKATRTRNIDTMKKLAEAVSHTPPPSDFERKEIYGVAMRYRYELFPPSPDSDPYLAKVPEQFQDELKRLGADQPAEIAPLWAYIAEITKPKEEDSFEIIVGSEQVDPKLKVIVSLGRRAEKPELSFDADKIRTSFAKGAEYIAVSVKVDEDGGRMVLYSQEFPKPKDLDEHGFKVSDAIKINQETRVLEVLIPGIRHSYQLPAKRQQAAP